MDAQVTYGNASNLDLNRLNRLFANNFEGGSSLLNDKYIQWLYFNTKLPEASSVVVQDERGEYVGFMGVLKIPYSYSYCDYINYVPTNVIVDKNNRKYNYFSKMIECLKNNIKNDKCFISGYPNSNALPFWKRHKMNFLNDLEPTICKKILPYDAYIHREAGCNSGMLNKYDFSLLSEWQKSQGFPIAKVTADFLLWRFFEHPLKQYHLVLLHNDGVVTDYLVYSVTRKAFALLVDWQGVRASRDNYMYKLYPTIKFTQKPSMSMERRIINKILNKKFKHFLTAYKIDGCDSIYSHDSFVNSDFI